MKKFKSSLFVFPFKGLQFSFLFLLLFLVSSCRKEPRQESSSAFEEVEFRSYEETSCGYIDELCIPCLLRPTLPDKSIHLLVRNENGGVENISLQKVNFFDNINELLVTSGKSSYLLVETEIEEIISKSVLFDNSNPVFSAHVFSFFQDDLLGQISDDMSINELKILLGKSTIKDENGDIIVDYLDKEPPVVAGMKYFKFCTQSLQKLRTLERYRKILNKPTVAISSQSTWYYLLDPIFEMCSKGIDLTLDCIDTRCVIEAFQNSTGASQYSKDILVVNYICHLLELSDADGKWLALQENRQIALDIFTQFEKNSNSNCFPDDCWYLEIAKAFVQNKKMGKLKPDAEDGFDDYATVQAKLAEFYCRDDAYCIIDGYGMARVQVMLNPDAYDEAILNHLNSGTTLTAFAESEYQAEPNNPKVYYNLYGYDGISRWINGEWVHTQWHWDATDWSYVYKNGIWESYELPTGIKYDFPNIVSELASLGHLALDCAGLVPVLGEVADGINAVWYFAEGDYVNGTLSAAAMIPIVGTFSTGAKWARNTLKLADNVFYSSKGVIFAVINGESRFAHVMKHAWPNPNRLYHGVFSDSDNIIGLIDDAFEKIKNNSQDVAILPAGPNQPANYTAYLVEMYDNIGYGSGKFEPGNPIYTKLKVVFINGTDKIITAFPAP